MKLKNIYILLVLNCCMVFVFADYVCVYNDTNMDFKVKKVETGSWAIQLYKLDNGVRKLDKELKDDEELDVKIPQKDGRLFRYKYGYKEGSKKAFLMLKERDSELKINLAKEGERTKSIGIYQVSQDYNNSSNRTMSPKECQWRHMCDKMIIISNESL